MDKVDQTQEPLHEKQYTRSLQSERTDNAGKIRSPLTHPLCKSSSDKEVCCLILY